MRPNTLSETATRINRGEPLEQALSEFLDAFYSAADADSRLEMLRDDHIIARRQSWRQLELAVLIRDRKERMWQDVYVREHPRMDIALQAYEQLGIIESDLILLALNGHCETKFAIGRRCRMDALQRPIRIAKSNRLARLYSHHIRLKEAIDRLKQRTFVRDSK